MKRIGIIVVFISLFFMLLGLYLTNYINRFDEFFYSLIISYKSLSMTNFMRFITFFASTKFIFTFMIIFLLIYFFKKKKLFLIFDIIILGEVIINNSIKLLVGRERPIIINLVTETSYSFPSGHTMVAVVFYGFLIYIINKLKLSKLLKVISIILLSIFIILIMISRIYLGVHFASDVFGGMCLSIAYLIFMIMILERKNYL